MKIRTLATLMLLIGALSGCALLGHAFCAPGCQSQTHETSSLVSFQTDVHNGNANVRVIARNTAGSKTGTGGGGSIDAFDVAALLLLAVLATRTRALAARPRVDAHKCAPPASSKHRVVRSG